MSISRRRPSRHDVFSLTCSCWCVLWCHCLIALIDNKQQQTLDAICCVIHTLLHQAVAGLNEEELLQGHFFFFFFPPPASLSFSISHSHLLVRPVCPIVSLPHLEMTKENEAAGFPMHCHALNWHLLSSYGATVPLSKKLVFFYRLARHFIAAAYVEEAAIRVEPF